MFVSQAHTFTQQSRLAITLAWIAGYTNLLSIVTCGHVTSHVSGTTSDLGHWTMTGAWDQAGFAFFLLSMFLLGAMLAGLAIEIGRQRGWESIYVLPIAIEAALLAGFAIGVEWHEPSALARGAAVYVMTGLASAAMGLQNATITRISSGVVRTTHVTGVLTDLGTELVALAAELRPRARTHRKAPRLGVFDAGSSLWRVALLGSILGSFALGAALGTLAFEWMPRLSMIPPVAFLLWIIYQDVARPIAEIEPSELVATRGLSLPAEIAVYTIRRDRGRQGRVHRFPNLLAWLDRVNANGNRPKVIVLDLDHVSQLDRSGAHELRAMFLAMRKHGQRLIVAGLSDAQVRELREAGLGELLHPDVICQDLELAIARALSFL